MLASWCSLLSRTPYRVTRRAQEHDCRVLQSYPFCLSGGNDASSKSVHLMYRGLHLFVSRASKKKPLRARGGERTRSERYNDIVHIHGLHMR